MEARHQQMQQMQRNFLNNSGHFSGSNGQHNGGQMPPGGNPNSMNQQTLARIQQMNARQMMSMRPNMMPPNMKTTNVRFPQGQQQAQERLHQANVHQMQAHLQQQQQQAAAAAAASGAKWHTPQQKQTSNGGMGLMGMSMSPPAAAGSLFTDTFKIPLRSPDTLRNQPNMNGSSSSGSFPLPNVSSTNPKTPSPSQKDQQKDLDNIDSVCNDSVNDLLATIAKLDSNGVQVLPEGRNKATSPQVHSSTDNIDPNSSLVSMNDKNNQPKDLRASEDPNEDWCACCMDGGELMCCDKCPKVFHQACHIPVISSLPDESETWQCLLCYNFSDATPGEKRVWGNQEIVDDLWRFSDQIGEKRGAGLSTFELKTLQRILLELFCQYELSSYFRVLPPRETSSNYYDIVTK
jgi:tripartite motif-containing protein 33